LEFAVGGIEVGREERLRLKFAFGFSAKKSKQCFNGDGIVCCNP
jgi:hypothetical protein